MKKLIFTLLFAITTFILCLAQVPNAFNYQAIVRNTSGEILDNQNISFRISILQESETGTVVYSETHSVLTNDFGLANLKIGTGTLVEGLFSPGGWGVAMHFIKVEIDPEGGNSFVHLGTSQLLSVPYAFHAETVEQDSVNDADADPVNEIQTLSLDGSELSLSAGGGTVTLPLSEGGDNWGIQTVVTDGTLDGNGTTSDPLSVTGVLTDEQTLSIDGNELSISDGNTVELPVGSENPWEDSDDGIQYNSGKVGINHDPADDEAYLQIWGDDLPAIEAVSTSASYPAVYAQNNSGTAAYFNGKVEIVDGTEGAGKVLTSNEGGKASWAEPLSGLWSQNEDDIYFDTGNVGIGTDSPNQTLTINGKTGNTYASFQNSATGNTNGDGLIIGSKISNKNAYFWNYENAPILFGTDNTLKMTLENDGDVLLEENLTVKGEINQSNTGTANMLPFAYGFIADNGTKNSGTPNVGTVSRLSPGQYKVEIPDLGSDYIVNVTPNHGIAYLTGVVTGRSSTYFIVAIWDTKNDAYKDGGFSFIVYNP